MKAALQTLVREWRSQSGVTCRLRVGDLARRLDAETQLHLYRMVQEALNNVARHARAGSVRIHLRAVAGGIVLTVADDGCGFDPRVAHKGIGLAGMRERAAALGGRLRIESSPGKGTRLVCRIPIPMQEGRKKPDKT